MSHHTLAHRLISRWNPHARRHQVHVHSMRLDDSVLRSREGVRAVLLSLTVLVLSGLVQVVIFVGTHSVALLADLVHNFGDALTAVPVGVALALRSHRAEKWSGLIVVVAIFLSAAFAFVASIQRLLDPRPLENLVVIAAAGVIGFIGNEIAALIRKRTGKRIRFTRKTTPPLDKSS